MGNQELKNLEKQDKYVFHGSENIIKIFEPRQAYTIVNGKQIPDGKPAIFSSPFVDYAIFMAIINKANCPKGLRSGCAWYNNKFKFTATKETLEQLSKDSKGYVYVFNKSDFKERSISEWVSYKEVKPVKMIEVRWSDFTQEIEKIENDMARD